MQELARTSCEAVSKIWSTVNASTDSAKCRVGFTLYSEQTGRKHTILIEHTSLCSHTKVALPQAHLSISTHT